MPSKRVLVAILYILAAPVFAVAWLLGLPKVARRLGVLKAGWVTCPNCGTRNPLNVKATCRRCGMTEYGNRLFCTHCRQVSKWFDCSGCGASIKVL